MNITAGNLTREQITDSVNEIINPFKENSLPQLRLQNNGYKGEYKPLTEEEIAISCSLAVFTPDSEYH